MVCSVLPAVEAVTTPPIAPSPLLAAPGAVAADGADAGVAAHYGDPLREQRLLTEGLAAVDLSHRGVVTVTGPDRLSWLHSITTQMLTGLAPLTSTESLVLSPKGHIEHDLHLVDDGETTWITTEPGTAGALDRLAGLHALHAPGRGRRRHRRLGRARRAGPGRDRARRAAGLERPVAAAGR